MDIFGLGSIMYTIIRGHFPHSSPSLTTRSWKEISDCFDKVDRLFKDGILPDVTDLRGGDIIRACWMKDLHSAKEVLNRLSTL